MFVSSDLQKVEIQLLMGQNLGGGGKSNELMLKLWDFITILM